MTNPLYGGGLLRPSSLNIASRALDSGGLMLTLTANPPVQVRFRHPNGEFYPSRTGRPVGTGEAVWTIELPDPSIQLRFQRLRGAEWVDADGVE